MLQITPTITKIIGNRTGYSFLKNIKRMIAETRIERPRKRTNSLETNLLTAVRIKGSPE
jgi:hypothetical protein